MYQCCKLQFCNAVLHLCSLQDIGVVLQVTSDGYVGLHTVLFHNMSENERVRWTEENRSIMDQLLFQDATPQTSNLASTTVSPEIGALLEILPRMPVSLLQPEPEEHFMPEPHTSRRRRFSAPSTCTPICLAKLPSQVRNLL